MNRIKSMQDLYVHLLKDIYNAEKQLVKALPQMARAAASPELKEAFEAHGEETKDQVTRLEKLFKTLGVQGSGEVCEATQGLVQEVHEFIAAKVDAQVRDAGLIACAQKIEHYEIASYGALCAFAHTLGLEDHAMTLHDTLEEEKAADIILSDLANGSINRMAAAA